MSDKPKREELPKDPAKLKDMVALYEARVSVLRLQAEERHLQESIWWDDFGGSDLWDRFRPLSNIDGDGTRWVPPSVPSDRRHGSEWPIWRNQVELDEWRNQARMRVAGNSFAKGLLRNLTNNVIGKGCAYDAEAELDEGQDPEKEHEQIVKNTQRVMDAFCKDNNWNGKVDPREIRTIAATKEREIFRRIQRDGECFIRFHGQDDGTMLVRFIEPSQIRDGHGGLPQDGWSYGIRHRMEPFEDVTYPIEYAIFWPDPSAKGGTDGGKDEGMWEEVDASEILHLKGPDTDSDVKRGLSEFLFDTGRALDRAAGLQRNASIGARHRAATAEIWQHSMATQSQVQSLADNLKVGTEYNYRTGKTTDIAPSQPGQVRRIDAGSELVAQPTDNTPQYLTAVQGDLQQASASSCSPAFWLGDTANANYSNLESASAPAVRAGQCDQEYYKSAFVACVWRAVLWAAECGKLPDNVYDLVDIKCEAPAVLHRNELEKAQEDQIGVLNGWKDRQTCTVERGGDWDTVSRNNREYTEQNGGAGLGLPMPDDKDDDKEGGEGKRPVPFGRVREAKDASGHEHAADGKFGTGGPKKAKTVAEEKPNAKALRAKAAHVMVNKDVQRYAEEHNEPRFAKVVGGVSHPDSEPMDVTAKNGDLCELKTLVNNSNDKITMDSYSQVRKIVKEQETGKQFHTIISDDQKVYNAGGAGKHGSDKDRVYYYRRGVAGSARLGTMHKCKDEAELKKLMAMSEDQLPSAAQRTDGHLRVGKWKAGVDAEGRKQFTNSKTGQVFKAKK